MKRREFITLLGVAVAGPSAILAQTTSKSARVALLSAGAPIADNSSQGVALIRGLAQRGYELGRNLTFERRGAEGHIDRLPRLVKELVASKVDVIVTFGYPPALACKQATAIPTVVVAVDPVGTGLVESLARPGGNLTGISDVSAEVTPKRMELLKEVAPRLRRVAMLWNANDLGMTLRYRASEAGAQALGISVLSACSCARRFRKRQGRAVLAGHGASHHLQQSYARCDRHHMLSAWHRVDFLVPLALQQDAPSGTAPRLSRRWADEHGEGHAPDAIA